MDGPSSDDDIIVMAWHRDAEDSLILLGWEHVTVLESKVRTQEDYSGEEPAKLQHLASQPMNSHSVEERGRGRARRQHQRQGR